MVVDLKVAVSGQADATVVSRNWMLVGKLRMVLDECGSHCWEPTRVGKDDVGMGEG